MALRLNVMHPVFMLLNGPPRAGKTHLTYLYAFRQDAFVLPAMSKHLGKESLFAALGWSDRNWARRFSQVAIPILYEFARSLLSQRQSCLIEANFVSHLGADRPAALGQTLPFAVAQIFVPAQPAVLACRFSGRAQSRSRYSVARNHGKTISRSGKIPFLASACCSAD